MLKSSLNIYAIVIDSMKCQSGILISIAAVHEATASAQVDYSTMRGGQQTPAHLRDSVSRASTFRSEGGANLLQSGKLANPVSFKSLPVELIVEIFVRCLPPGEIHRHVLADPFKAPLLLCHVCSTWRTISFSVPQIWDTLSLHFSGVVSSVILNNALNITRFWFGKALDRPLYFSIDIYDADCDDYCGLEFLLLSYSSQFCCLNLRTRSERDLSRFLSLLPGHLAHLEYLHFVTGALHHDSGPITVFSSAPRLRRAFISVDDGWSPNPDITSRMLLPWAQLTHLEIGAGLGYTLWSNLFSQCPLLQYCDISFDYMDVTDAAAAAAIRGPLVVPQLIDMSVTDVSNADPTRFQLQDLDVTFPILEAFEIRHCLINLAWIEAFARPLGYHRLRRLSLHRNAISMDDLISFLRATVSLVELSLWLNISKDVDHRRLWDALAFKSKRGCLLPKLEVFDLWMWIYEGDFYASECANMIRSRWDVQENSGADFSTQFCRLQRVSMHLHPDQERVKWISDILEPYKIKGMGVSVDSAQYLESRSKQWL